MNMDYSESLKPVWACISATTFSWILGIAYACMMIYLYYIYCLFMEMNIKSKGRGNGLFHGYWTSNANLKITMK